jgi:Ca2+-binding RTX toxin-like protein
MMRSVFACGRTEGGRRRNRGANSRQIRAMVEGLESRNLMTTTGSVVQSQILITITPHSTGPAVATVSYAIVNGATELDVSLNGANHYFNPAQVGVVYYMGSAASGSQVFQNETSLHSIAWGGSGSNEFIGGTGSDEFIGGAGPNVFYAGTGLDLLVGGAGANVYNENSVGSGIISESGGSNTANVPSGSSPNYTIYSF